MQLLEELIESLTVLPGVGQKTARRYAYQILDMSIEKRTRLMDNIADLNNIKHCQKCKNLTLEDICDICQNERFGDTLVVVNTPSDIDLLERVLNAKYYYYVLGGVIDPLNGRTSEDLNLAKLIKRVKDLETKEVILVLPTNLEGELTSNYLTKLLEKEKVEVSKLAQGVPIGGNIEYLDELTLLRSIEGRQKIEIKEQND